MHIEEITTAAALERIRRDWVSLWERVPSAGPFQHPDWLLPWWRHVGGCELLVLCVRDGAELVGIAPFYVFADPATGERQLTLLGNGVSDACDVLIEGRGGRVARALAQALRDSRVSWTSCDLRDVPAGSALPSIMSGEAGVSICADTPTVVADLSGWSEGRVSPKRMADLRRCRRRAEEIGPLRFAFATEHTVAECMDILFALHGSRWAARGQSGVLCGGDLDSFYRDVAARFARPGWLRLSHLAIGDHNVGACLGFQLRGRAYHYISGFDPALARLGIGALMLHEIIERAVRDGAREFDFLRGEEDYKRRWGGVARPQGRIRMKRQNVEVARAGAS